MVVTVGGGGGGYIAVWRRVEAEAGGASHKVKVIIDGVVRLRPSG